MDFAAKLKCLLEENNMTQSDLCKKSGIPSSLIANYCSGKKNPAMGNAVALAEAFGISLDELVGRTPTEKTPRFIVSMKGSDAFEEYDELPPAAKEKLQEYYEMLRDRYSKK